jgi:hypothetical protein
MAETWRVEVPEATIMRSAMLVLPERSTARMSWPLSASREDRMASTLVSRSREGVVDVMFLS